METCDNCKGAGLVSSGAVPHELGVGATLVCPACSGKGNVFGGDVPSEVLSVENVPVFVVPEPKDGDPCEDFQGKKGFLRKTDDGFVCEISVPQVAEVADVV